MNNAVRKEGNNFVLNGDHASVKAQVIRASRPGVRVTVGPVADDLRRVLYRGDEGPALIYYEGPAGTDRIRSEVMLAGAQRVRSGQCLVFTSTGS